MSKNEAPDDARFLALVESTIEGATKEHTTVFTAELNMLKFMYEHTDKATTREQILIKARSLYRNWMFTLNRIEEYRAIGAPATEDSAERGE